MFLYHNLLIINNMNNEITTIYNHMLWESDPEGTERMFRKVMSRQSVFYSKIVRSKEEGREMLSDENFFDGEESPEKK